MAFAFLYVSVSITSSSWKQYREIFNLTRTVVWSSVVQTTAVYQELNLMHSHLYFDNCSWTEQILPRIVLFFKPVSKRCTHNKGNVNKLTLTIFFLEPFKSSSLSSKKETNNFSQFISIICISKSNETTIYFQVFYCILSTLYNYNIIKLILCS